MDTLKTELNLPINEVIARLTGALAEEGLGIVSDIDVQALMVSKLNEEFRPYRILGACAPGLAKSLIGVDPEIGAILPCNIVVQECDGRTQISVMDPGSILRLANHQAIDDIAHQVQDILYRVLTRLQN